jgi:hypothetical protein
MTEQPLLILDVDGVILDFVSSFSKYMKDLGFKQNLDSKQDDWYMRDWFLTDDGDTVDPKDYVTEFSSKPRYIEPLSGAYHLRSFLGYAKGLDYKVITLSACSKVWEESRVSQLDGMFPNLIDDHHIIGNYFTKHDYIKEFLHHDKRILVEDNWDNAISCSSVADSYLFNRSYNITFGDNDKIKRINMWREIEL